MSVYALRSTRPKDDVKFIEALFFLSFLVIVDNNSDVGAAAAPSHSTPTSFAPNVHVNNNASTASGNNLNINLPDNNAVLRLEVELRDKNVRRRPNQQHRTRGYLKDRNRPVAAAVARKPAPLAHHSDATTDNYFVPMEKVSGSFYSPFLVVGSTQEKKTKNHEHALQQQQQHASCFLLSRHCWSSPFFFSLPSIYLILFWLLHSICFVRWLCVSVSVEFLFCSRFHWTDEMAHAIAAPRRRHQDIHFPRWHEPTSTTNRTHSVHCHGIRYHNNNRRPATGTEKALTHQPRHAVCCTQFHLSTLHYYLHFARFCHSHNPNWRVSHTFLLLLFQFNLRQTYLEFYVKRIFYCTQDEQQRRYVKLFSEIL